MEVDGSRGNASSRLSSDGGAMPSREADGLVSPSAASTSSRSSSSSIASASGLNYIEHRVSKLDTLAGVAIKYGVEVADIKRMNGLVTDIQMFGHKSIQIPLPGRHPPSPIISNSSSCNGDPPSSQRKVSAAMKTLQGYYGLTPSRRAPTGEDFDLRFVNRLGKTLNWEEFDSQPGHRKTRSLVNGFSSEEETDREKREATPPPELLLKEDQGGAAFSARSSAKKGLALRQKSSSVSNLQEAGGGGGSGDGSATTAAVAGKLPPGRWAGNRSDGKAKGITLDGFWKNKAALD